ncbi:glycoside hydrolase family 2 protein [Lachnospira pectinoschiza]|uniref:Beta-galactosidase n=1 Tax=Lachnospira pectinoschiza TaxID=28052 RepID=A0A1G9T1H6_9FIRM|nr:glycoside hydrolase family 2 TIM barrel-domain containing protein [Lachnospira pectinoschiza]SDM41510.1 beta-galactosidase [Lachnospira pectinoschiza]
MNKISFNEGWLFEKLEDKPLELIDGNEIVSFKENVNLPHTFYKKDEYYRGLARYSKKLMVDSKWRHLFLDILAADQHALVFADDVKIMEHKGGYSRFRCEIPASLYKDKKEVDLKIYVTNKLDSEISPLTGDFTVFGGLNRGVNILYTENESYFDPTYYGTDGVIVRTSTDGKSGQVDLEIHAKTEIGDTFLAELKDSSGENVAIAFSNNETSLSLKIDNPKLWNAKGEANLYTVETSILRADKEIDKLVIRTGFRKIGIDANKGLFLNDKAFRIKGVSKHQDVGDKYSAVSDDDIKRDFDLIDEIGANSIRLSHYQHSSYTYDCADERGYLVWAEIPMLKMTDNKNLLDNAKEQLKELILQNIHHPSIYCWGIQNEIGMFNDKDFMYEDLLKSRKLVKDLDSSRLVTAANLYTVKFKSKLNQTTDMIGYNVYFGWYYGKMHDYDRFLDKFHAECPQLPIGVSEYGVDANVSLHSSNPVVKDYSEEYQALYHENVYRIFETKPYLWGSYVWNMFDFSSAIRKEAGLEKINAKGLVSFNRDIKKDAFYYYKAKWSEEKFLHICQKRFEKRAEEYIDIKVYTNLDSAYLILNDKEISSANNNGNGTIIFEKIRLENKESFIKVVSGNYVDSAKFIKVEKEEKSYRLEDNEAGTSVKNWFIEDDLIKEGYYSIKDCVGDLIDNGETKDILNNYIPDILNMITTNEDFPRGLALQSVINRAKPKNLDINKFNGELNRIKAEY